MILAYKLLRVRRNGSLGPLFIGRRIVIESGVWLKAKAIRTPGFKFRPGWHACAEPIAPHLSTRGRAWYRVVLQEAKRHQRPSSQGGLWYTAKWMMVLGPLVLE